MIYEFIDKDGAIVEINYPAGKAPPEGALVRHEGLTVRRILSMGSITINTHPNSGQYPYVSNALPRSIGRDGEAKLVREKPGGRLKPLVESAAHERRLMAKYDLVKAL